MTAPAVVHIIDHLGLGGAQRVVADLAWRQARGGRPVTVISLRGPTALSRRIAASGVTVRCLGRGRLDPRQYGELVAALRALRPAVAHLHLMGAHTIGRAAAVAAAVPAVVVHDHEASAEIYTHPGPLLAARRLAEAKAPPERVAYLVLSEDAAAYATAVRRLAPGRLAVVPNGVDLEYLEACALSRPEARRRLGLPEGGALIVGAGRLRPVKGWDVLLAALAHLPPDVHLAIAGDGPQRDALAAAVEGAGLASRLHLLGHLDDVRPLLRAGDLYVQPSRREAFGLAAVEAGACGLPVVASAVGGVRGVIRHGETGLLVPPERPEALAAAITGLLGDPALAARMGAAGRALAREQFSCELMAERVERVYDTLTAGACR